MSKSTAVQLRENETLDVIRGLPDHMLQGRRMIEYLAQNPQSPSGHVAQQCAIGNLSDVARNTNPYIFKHRLMIACERPPLPIHNKFDEPSNQFLWSLHALPEAANDSIYLQEAED